MKRKTKIRNMKNAGLVALRLMARGRQAEAEPILHYWATPRRKAKRGSCAGLK